MHKPKTPAVPRDAETVVERVVGAFELLLLGVPMILFFLLLNRLFWGVDLPGPLMTWTALYWIIGASVVFGFLLPRQSSALRIWVWDCFVGFCRWTMCWW